MAPAVPATGSRVWNIRRHPVTAPCVSVAAAFVRNSCKKLNLFNKICSYRVVSVLLAGCSRLLCGKPAPAGLQREGPAPGSGAGSPLGAESLQYTFSVVITSCNPLKLLLEFSLKTALRRAFLP